MSHGVSLCFNYISSRYLNVAPVTMNDKLVTKIDKKINKAISIDK